MYHGGFSFFEAWSIPVAWRRWFIQRINVEMQRQNGGENGETGADAGTQNKDIRRLLQGQAPRGPKRFG